MTAREAIPHEVERVARNQGIVRNFLGENQDELLARRLTVPSGPIMKQICPLLGSKKSGYRHGARSS